MNLLQRVLRWWNRKSAMDDDTGWVDVPLRRPKQPSPHDLLAELKSTAWACATINASVCAAHPPRLFVAMGPGMPRPRCLTRSVDVETTQRLKKQTPGVPTSHIEEVVDHPLLGLLAQVNAAHTSFDLWEATQLSLEIHGCAYWLLDLDPLVQQPRAIWILPAHLVTPIRDPGSQRLVDAYEYRGQTPQRYAPERILAFRNPDPRDPYASGISPLKACFDQAALVSVAKLVRQRKQKFVAVSCHDDVEEWLQPDWVYRPAEDRFTRRLLRRRPAIDLDVVRVSASAWPLFAPHHYLSSALAKSAVCFLASWRERPVAFSAWLPFVGSGPKSRREHRTVTLPDYQGVGVGNALSDFVASLWAGLGYRALSTTTHPAMIRARLGSKNWSMHRAPSFAANNEGRLKHATTRLTAGFTYVGPALAYAAARVLLEESP